MVYFVTGATGHIGNNFIAKVLKETDYQIKVLVLPDDENVKLFKNNERIQIVYGDVLDKEFLEREIEPEMVVFHFAGIIDISSSDKNYLYKVNVEGTRNVCEVCFAKKVKKLIYTSSVHAIRTLPNNEFMTEPTEFDENLVIGDYAKSKTEATRIVFDYAKKGLNVTVVYPAGVIGPSDWRISCIGQLILDLCNEKIKGRVKGRYNFVDVRDIADGIFAAAQNGKNCEGYLLSGYIVTVDQLFESVYKYLGRTKLMPKYPLGLLKFLTPFFELSAKLAKKQPLFTKYSLYTINSNCNFSNKKARVELGFNPRTHQESFNDAIEWFAKNKKELLRPDVLKFVEDKINKSKINSN